jgi:hypothetical protein
MQQLQQMWTHAHDAVIENESALRAVTWMGSRVTFRGNKGHSTWVHFAPPTPVIVGDRRLRVHDVRLRFRTATADAWIAAAHIYDGDSRVATHDGLLALSRTWRVKRIAVRGRPPLRWGIGISLMLVFHSEPGADDEARAFGIEFASVGCAVAA